MRRPESKQKTKDAFTAPMQKLFFVYSASEELLIFPSVLLSTLPVIELLSFSLVLRGFVSLVCESETEEDGFVVIELSDVPQPVKRRTEQIRTAQTVRIMMSFFILGCISFIGFFGKFCAYIHSISEQ